MSLTRDTYQRNSTWNAPYTFSGKEKDAETGNGYFGARYYDSGLSIWLSVDPMSDKYPCMSPYNYCANNPVRMVDPDGRDIINITSNGVISIKPQDGPDVIVFEKTGLRHNLDAHGVFDNKITTNEHGHQVISGFSEREIADFFYLFAANTRVEWGRLRYKNTDGSTACFLGTSRDYNGSLF
jgi:RHS repeat-associated protein